MDEIKAMLREMMAEMKQIKVNQESQQEKMDEILNENRELKKHTKMLGEKIDTLEEKIKRAETEKKKNNLITNVWSPQVKDNIALKYEIEDFIKRVLRTEMKVKMPKEQETLHVCSRNRKF